MSKPKRIVLPDGTVVWEIRMREGGRGSSSFKRRFLSSKDAMDFHNDFLEQRKKRLMGYVEVGSFQSTTFAKEAANWLDQLKLRCSPGHHRRVKDIIKDFNKDYGSFEPNKITRDLLAYWQGKLKERPGRKPGSNLANASVNRSTEAVCAALNYSAEQKRIPYSPLVGFQKLPKNSPEMLFWSEDEACAFLDWTSRKYSDWSNKSRMRSRKNYIAYLIAINTGIRAGELWGLRSTDLFFSKDKSGNTMFIRRQFNGLQKDYGPLKGELLTDSDKSRHVPCSEELREELETLIKFNRIGRDEPLFQSVRGNPVNHDSFVDRFDRDVSNWKGRRIRFHDLRHTAATLMLAKNIDIKTVSEILGHEDLQTTMIYVHLLGNRIKQVASTFSVLPSLTSRPILQVVHGGKQANAR